LVTPEAFVRAHTVLAEAPLLPGIRLHLATEITPIWQATEAWLEARGIAPPFWAFAWPGSVALARLVLDGAIAVAGLRVLDFAAGCGLAGIAAAQAGAALVEACEIDPLAVAATRLNAAENGVAVTALLEDMVGQACRWDVILAGDVCYEAPMARHITPWLHAMAGQGARVLIADPGRAYFSRDGVREIGRMAVPTTRELEDRDSREVTIVQLLPK
jgi:predicted nicotinamide N-methyase